MNLFNANRIGLPRILVALLASLVLLGFGRPSPAAPGDPPFSEPELERMLAPIALYPDPLLSQILMAATYPVEVVEAARWSREHPNLHGEDAVDAASVHDWDPSVIALTAFPRVLDTMDARIDWTRDLGDAFLDQQADVMDAVQRLRQRAYASGHLRSSDAWRVVADGPTLVILPANPHIVHLPYYDPLVVYGGWRYPGHPPVRWAAWPGWQPRPGFGLSVYWGPWVRVSPVVLIGGFDWRRRVVHVVDVSPHYRRGRDYDVPRHVAPPVRWVHREAHRRGVPYRHHATAQRGRPDVERREGPPVGPHFAAPGRSGGPERFDRDGDGRDDRRTGPRTAQPRESDRRFDRDRDRDDDGRPDRRAGPARQLQPREGGPGPNRTDSGRRSERAEDGRGAPRGEPPRRAQPREGAGPVETPRRAAQAERAPVRGDGTRPGANDRSGPRETADRRGPRETAQAAASPDVRGRGRAAARSGEESQAGRPARGAQPQARAPERRQAPPAAPVAVRNQAPEMRTARSGGDRPRADEATRRRAPANAERRQAGPALRGGQGTGRPGIETRVR